VVAGTASNDTITAAAGTLQASDVISDASTADADVMNLSMNSYASTQTLISGVETINVTGVYTSAGLDAQNVVNTKVLNLAAGITGSTGTLVNASAQKIAAVKAGSNIDTLNVNAAAYTGGTGGGISVDAGAASTISIGNIGNSGADTYSVNPAKNATLNLAGGSGGSDTFTVTLPGGAVTLDVQNNGATGDIDVLNLVSNTAANTITLTAGSELLADATDTTDQIVVSGTNNLTITGDLDLIGTGARGTNVLLTKASGYTGTVTWNSNAGSTATNINRAVGIDVLNLKADPGAIALTVNEATTVNLEVASTATSYQVDGSGSSQMAAAAGTLKLGLTGNSAANAIQAAVVTGDRVGTLVISNNTIDSTITLLNTSAGDADTVVVSGSKALTISGWTTDAGEVLTAAGLTGNLTVTTITNGGTVVGGSGSDTISGGATADALSGGAGDDILRGGSTDTTADTMTGGLGNDRFILAGTAVDRITDFSISGTNGTDVLALALGASGVLGVGLQLTLLEDGNNNAVTAGSTAKVKLVSAATTLATGDNVIVLSGTFADSAAMELAIEGGTRALTLGAVSTAADDILIVWSDGTNSYIGGYNITSTTAAITAGGYNGIATLAGVTSVDTIASANFLFIA